MTASTRCPHTDVHYHLNLHTSGDTPLRRLEVTGHCTICGAKMRFIGPTGSMPDRPMIGPFGEELRAPFCFGDERPTGRELGYRIEEQDGVTVAVEPWSKDYDQ